EMKRRLREELDRTGPREALRVVDRLRIGTIDSFCTQILRQHATEAGLDPRFEILDETEALVMQERIARQVLENAAEKDPLALSMWFSRYEPEQLVASLTRAGGKLRNAGDPLVLLDEWTSAEGASFEHYAQEL